MYPSGMRALTFTSLAAVFMLVACGNDDSADGDADASIGRDGGARTTADAATSRDAQVGSDASLADASDDDAHTFDEDSGHPLDAKCALVTEPANKLVRNEAGCVDRAWIAPYAGTYESAKCRVTIDVTKTAPAVFTLKYGTLIGESFEWEGKDWGEPFFNDDLYERGYDSAALSQLVKLTFRAQVAYPDVPAEDVVELTVMNPTSADPTFGASWASYTDGEDGGVERDCGAMTRL